MICSQCGTENEPGRKFCGECGARLAAACPACGAQNRPDAKFCGECGTALTSRAQTAPAAPVQATEAEPAAERRLVSVLFADLVGFTTLSEGLDSEEVRELQSRYFEAARQVIERYGGTVEKFIGDAVMAVWGAPVVHEDDAERAVRAALQLVETVSGLESGAGGEKLRLRAAVMTGEATVALGARGQGMVTGDLVNTAARLQSVADAGSVLVGEQAVRGASGAIAFEPVGDHALKGKALPVPAWRATAVVAGVGGKGRSEGIEPPFVGRDAELRLLKDVFHATATDRRARLVSVAGQAGVGKSRLAWELEKYLDGLVDLVYWHQGRSPAYGEGVTFWALGEMVRRRAGIAETDDPATSRARLAEMLADFVTDPDERAWLEPRLEGLLGLSETATGDREDLFAAWRTFFETVADRAPAILVFDDLQWADAGLLDFIESLLEWSRGHPLLIVTLARPELLERRPNWGAGQRNFTALHLEPLPDEVMAELLSAIAPGLPRAAVRRILARAQGIPLYAVETMRMLIDTGRLAPVDGGYRLSGDLTELEVPDSLHALVAARLDSLDPGDRTLLQQASVLGLTFTAQALAAITGHEPEELGRRLRTLVRKELLVLDADPRSPERGQYGFVQSVIREVAYSTLAKRDRRSLHAAAARYYEALGDEELAGVLASHYLDAYRATPEGPEADAVAAQARVALRAAADRATALGSHEQAVAFLQQAVIATTDGAEQAALKEKAADAAQAAARFDLVEQLLREARSWHEQQGDRAGAALATARIGSSLLFRGQVEPAIAMLEEALGELPDLDADPAVVTLAAELARAYMVHLESAKAVAVSDRVLAAAERMDLVHVVVEALNTKGSALANSRPYEGRALLAGALALAQRFELATSELRARHNLATMWLADDPRESLALCEGGLALARKLGRRESVLDFTGAVADGWFQAGEWDRVLDALGEFDEEELPALERLEYGATRARIHSYRGAEAEAQRLFADLATVVETVTHPQYRAVQFHVAAEAAFAAGRLRDALALAERAGETSPDDRWWAESPAARTALAQRDVDRARAALRVLDGATVRGRLFTAFRRQLEAGVAALEGRRQEAIAVYHEAMRLFRERRQLVDLALCQLEFVELIGASDPDAAAAASEARDFFERVGAKPFLARLDAALAATPTGGSPYTATAGGRPIAATAAAGEDSRPA